MARIARPFRSPCRLSPLWDFSKATSFSSCRPSMLSRIKFASVSSLSSTSLDFSSSSNSLSPSLVGFPNSRCSLSLPFTASPVNASSSVLRFPFPSNSCYRRHLSSSTVSNAADHHTVGNEVGREALLISKAEIVLKENSKRREKIANAVADFAQQYRGSSTDERRRFLLHLVDNFGVSQTDVSIHANALNNFLAAQQDNVADPVSHRKLIRQLDKLRQSLIPAYDRLFTAIGALEDGIKLVVDLRADLLSLIAASKPASSSSVGETASSSLPSTVDDPTLVRLRDLDRSLKELLSSWFSVGLLKLETVDWKSSCDLLQFLEKVSEYERVHPVRSWTDLRHRVGPYRRCFIFTHSSMPRDPVMVLHTYLSDSISQNIDEIIPRPGRSAIPDHAPLAASVDFHPGEESPTLKSSKYEEENPTQIQAAIFYSINNTQNGLNGVDLGHYLIKNAVKALQREFPHLHVFSTLSPIRGFKEWFMIKLGREVKHHTARVPGGRKLLQSEEESVIEDSDRLFTDAELKSMMTELMSGGYSEESYQLMLFTQKLHVFLSTNKWYQNRDFVKALEAPLKRLCVHYLYVEKHRGFALNPIANFHLRNGATLWRLNWLADVTPKGLEDAFGLMVNYRYFPEKTQENNRRYSEEKIIDISEDVLKILSSSSAP